jgi:hypothetical protein
MKLTFRGITPPALAACAVAFACSSAFGQTTPYESSADFVKYAEKLRESAILHMEPQVVIPTMSRMLNSSVSGKYPWKTGIVTTTFWIGEPAGGNNPVHNISSSWDLNWMQSFGGYDDPNPGDRRNFVCARFTPHQNPFYIALPYNDVTHGSTKPEAKVVIPWFREAFVEEGKSICQNRWVEIRNSSNKVCYAQWSDCGPFRTDHWQYVFGNEKPKPNLNGGAGLDIAPAVRDYLGLNGTDVTDWRFVEASEVPTGPWSLYGDNNTFVQKARASQERVASNIPQRRSSVPPPPAPPATAQDAPTIVTQLPP